MFDPALISSANRKTVCTVPGAGFVLSTLFYTGLMTDSRKAVINRPDRHENRQAGRQADMHTHKISGDGGSGMLQYTILRSRVL